MRSRGSITSLFRAALVVFTAVLASANAGAQSPGPYRPTPYQVTAAPGIEYLRYRIIPSEIVEGEVTLHVVRIDPSRARLKLLAASEHDRKLRTTGEWCSDYKLVAAINAGMFYKDYSTNVGYLRNGSHVQNSRWHKQYRSVLAFDARKKGIPAAVMVDLDEPGARKQLDDYAAVIQNLRLMKTGGVNVWQKTERKWSEASLAMDNNGRLLFIFCRYPLAMWKFNRLIGSLDLGVSRMMHLEGGPWASLSVRSREIQIDLSGDYAGDYEGGGSSDASHSQLPLPNVIGVQMSMESP